MSHYLAALTGILLLVTTALGTWEIMQVLGTRHAVEVALLEGQAWLAPDGGLSPRVRTRVEQRLRQQGLDPSRARITGSPAGTPAGQAVWLKVTYRHRLPLAWTGLFLATAGERGTEVDLGGRAEVPSARIP